jgi:flavin-dependent dehydrogenase
MVEVYWSKWAEAYVTPVADDLVGVAILYFPDRVAPGPDDPPFERLLRGFPALRERLGDPVTTARGAGPFEQRTARRVYGRILLVGDAAGYLDPITGEGIRLGLETARAAIDAIARETPQDYERGWKRAIRRYWWMTDGLLWASRSPLRPWLVPTLCYTPGLMSAAIGALGG